MEGVAVEESTDNFSFFTGISQSRAQHLNKKRHQQLQEQTNIKKAALLARLEIQYGKRFTELNSTNLGTLWSQFVTTKEEAIDFLELMYPHFTKEMRLAYLHMYERHVAGEITISSKYIRNVEKTCEIQDSSVWDPMKDIEQQRQLGLINIAEKKMQELMTQYEQGQP